MPFRFDQLKCSTNEPYEPTPEEVADYAEWEQRMRDCYLNRLQGTHADVGEDGCPECGYGGK